jgi:hypothetical protein
VRSAVVHPNRRRGAGFEELHDSRGGLLQRLGWGARDTVGFVVASIAAIAILINVLFLQSGTHPAPMFKAAVAPANPVVVPEIATATVPRPRPVEATPTKVTPPPPRTPGEIITDIQRELARRGFYDGAIDGLYGPRTDGAIRDFEQMAGLRPSPEPSEALLQAIARAPAKTAKGASVAANPGRTPPVRNEVPQAAGHRPAVRSGHA